MPGIRSHVAFALVVESEDRAGAAAVGRHAGAKRASTAADAAAPSEAHTGAGTRARKRRRSQLVLSDTEQQDEARSIKARTGATPGRAPGSRTRQRRGTPVRGEWECRQMPSAAASRSEVIADSLEVDSCVADAADDMLNDVSSADTGHHDRADAQPHQAIQQAQPLPAQQPQQPQQQEQPGLVGEQGRAVDNAGPSAGAGKLLSGKIQWVGPSVEPPAQLGLNPSQHQTYYNAFTRVCLPIPAFTVCYFCKTPSRSCF